MVSVNGLTQVFGSRPVLRDIDLRVEDGEILAIMGSSGGGKTTLLRCISGLLRPTQGHVEVEGIDVQKQPEEARRRMGMVFQSAALFDYMNVGDNVRFGIGRRLRLPRGEQELLVARSLERVGLEPEEVEPRMPSELSGGMRKRVGIARALALSPKVMLYDEPTTGLDPITTYTIDKLIVDLRNSLSMTSIVVSHDVSSVFRVADRIAFLHAGELIFNGSPADFARSGDPSIVELVRKSEARDFSVASD